MNFFKQNKFFFAILVLSLTVFCCLQIVSCNSAESVKLAIDSITKETDERKEEAKDMKKLITEETLEHNTNHTLLKTQVDGHGKKLNETKARIAADDKKLGSKIDTET